MSWLNFYPCSQQLFKIGPLKEILIRQITDHSTIPLKFPKRICTCSCPVFQKQYYCKHWLGVAVRKKLITVCEKSTTILVKTSRGRPFDYETEEHSRRLGGRPAKVAPALVIESQSSAASPKKHTCLAQVWLNHGKSGYSFGLGK